MAQMGQDVGNEAEGLQERLADEFFPGPCVGLRSLARPCEGWRIALRDPKLNNQTQPKATEHNQTQPVLVIAVLVMWNAGAFHFGTKSFRFVPLWLNRNFGLCSAGVNQT
jgi:hypothetical protein